MSLVEKRSEIVISLLDGLIVIYPFVTVVES